MSLKQRVHSLYHNLGPRGQAFLANAYAAIPLRWRKKRGFWSYLEFLRKSQWESAEWHEQYQRRQLHSLVKYAAATTEYYRNLFEAHNIYPAEIFSLEDLTRIPILQKTTLVQQSREFLPKDSPKRRLVLNSTSGSTGEPFKFHVDYYAVMREEAFAVRHWENAGMKIGEPCIYLRSYIPRREGATYHFDPVNNRHYFSAYHLDETNLRFYCNKILQSQVKFVFGYPSSLEILSDFLAQEGKTLQFEAAVTGSEMLPLSARTKIESALNTKVYDWYGLAEPTVTMGQCEKGNYHLFSEYGILELLDANNNPVTKEGEIGRIIGTNFTNRALPLIRYDTGDLGVYTSHKCSCGRGTPVMISSIQGRQDDLLIGANGQLLPSVNFYSLFAKLGGAVSRFQLVQNDLQRFSLKLIRGPEFTEKSVSTIVDGLIQRIGGRPSIEIETVDRITPSKAGKIRAVIRNCSLISTPTGDKYED